VPADPQQFPICMREETGTLDLPCCLWAFDAAGTVTGV